MIWFLDKCMYLNHINIIKKIHLTRAYTNNQYRFLIKSIDTFFFLVFDSKLLYRVGARDGFSSLNNLQSLLEHSSKVLRFS